MSDQRNRIEEQTLDALLLEALGKVEPPDVTDRVLARLADVESDAPLPAVPAGLPAVSPHHRASSSGQPSFASRAFGWSIALTAAIAASTLLLFWVRDAPLEVEGLQVAVNEPVASGPLVPIAVAPGPTTDELAEPSPSLHPRGIPLVADSPRNTKADNDAAGSRSPAVSVGSEPVPAVVLVSKQFDREWAGYWNAVGIQPTAEAEDADVASRLESVLGVKLPTELLTDAEGLQAELNRDSVAREIATRWLDQITERGLRRLDEASRLALIESLAACIEGTQPLDQTLVGWIGGTSPVSSDFYAAISHSGQHAMVRRLAELTMNVDLRCIRCHDSTIEGSDQQQDYWGFAALLARGVARDSDGQLQIDPRPATSKPLFFELADGRQRLAEPLISVRWIGGDGSEPVNTVTSWAGRLVGSQALARGAVNSLWRLVHGQSLQGRVVDPMNPPHHESLDRIEEFLVQDLIRSRFDVARTLSLIVASPVTRRSVPESLRPEQALVVSESDKRSAIEAVNAFAAALPRRNVLPLRQRLDQSMRAIGGRLDQDGRPFVAQIGGDERPATSNATALKPLSADFPVRADSLPVQWLTLIDDDQSQVDHLGYLAGLQKLPANVQAAVGAMRADEQLSKELLLHRVWWIVGP